MGHYAGLMHLGREAMGSKSVPVYVLPRMQNFLENNGPWSQLVRLNNIQLIPISADVTKELIKDFNVRALTVPHRDEFSETAAFVISAGNKRILYLPDIDKWEKWDRDAIALMNQMDMAFVDATFWSASELEGSSIAEVPHPLVTESMDLLKSVSSKIFFIHLNHTNPLLQNKSYERMLLKKNGFKMAEQGQTIQLK
jgi:pyrroloquinoline quinone biosynthesis protein B